MTSRADIVVNGRCLTREQPTGVDQLPMLLVAAATEHGLTVAMPTSTGRIRTNLWEQFVLPWRARSSALLSLANSGPTFARRHVTMIHDMSPWDHPEWFGRAYRVKTSVINRLWARQSPLILTPSQFSSDRASDVLGIEPDRLCAVGNAHRWPESIPRRTPRDVPYVLTVSTLSTRKNLALILDAWPSVALRHAGLRLKVVGARGGSVLSDAGSTHEVENVDYLGYVTDPELDQLLLGARALVSASQYEGFNIPLLDALVIGVPVAASDIEVHREIYGCNASLFDPNDPLGCAAAIEKALHATVETDVMAYYDDRFRARSVVQRVVDAARRHAV